MKLKILPKDTTIEDLQKTFPNIQFISTENPRYAFSELGVCPYPLNSRIPVSLIKFGEKEFMEKLLRDGEVYMQTTSHFRELESLQNDCSDGRGDAYEGVDLLLHVNEVTIDNVSITSSSSIIGKYSHNNDGLVFSTYGVFDSSQVDGNLIITEEMKKMGNTAIVINDPLVFLDRCATFTKKIGGKLMANSITYYNEDIGDYYLCPWLKRDKFAYQSEYRLFIPCGNKVPLKLKIGSIGDIAELISL